MNEESRIWKTWDEVRAERFHLKIPKMKGRRYRARIRSNKRWLRFPYVKCVCGKPYVKATNLSKPCHFKSCEYWFCRYCKRTIGSMGPIGCPCSRGGYGHGRYSEQPKPHVKVKV